MDKQRMALLSHQLFNMIPYALVPALFVVDAVLISGYASRSSLMALLVQSSLLGLASIGQTVAIIVGGIDLSIPAVMGLSNVMITELYGYHWPFALACLFIAGIAIAIGVTNALASVFLRVHPLIITLGTGLIVTGGVLTWNHGAVAGTVPPWLTSAVEVIGKTGPIPVPAVVLIWAGLSLATIIFQRRTRLGREIYATGANSFAARLARVRSTWSFVVVFTISAILAAGVGVLFAGFSGTADVTVGQPYLFETITAVVVGGTSLLGGRGGYARTIAGALIITQLTTLLVGLGLGASMQEAFLGILVLLLVTVYGREVHISARV